MKPPILNANRHPADDLADVREEIRKLKEKEDFLRRKFLAGDFDLVGEEFEISIKARKSKRFNKEKLKAEIGDDIARFFDESESVAVLVSQIEVEDA